MEHKSLTVCKQRSIVKSIVYVCVCRWNTRALLCINRDQLWKVLYTCIHVCLQVEHKSLTLGEVLDGDRMALSLYDIGFKSEWLYGECHLFLSFCLKCLSDVWCLPTLEWCVVWEVVQLLSQQNKTKEKHSFNQYWSVSLSYIHDLNLWCVAFSWVYSLTYFLMSIAPSGA